MAYNFDKYDKGQIQLRTPYDYSKNKILVSTLSSVVI